MNTAMEELNKLFLDHPDGTDARIFLDNYKDYCHLIDDIVDHDIEVTPDTMNRLAYLALHLFSTNFYRKYIGVLFPIFKMIHNTYFDTVKMEHSTEEWQQKYASVLKQVGDEMTLTIIDILGGYEKRKVLGVLIRGYTNTIQTQQGEEN